MDLVGKVEQKVEKLKKSDHKFKPSKIAIMGCAVNGPGEAKDADIGIAGAKKGQFIIFKKGEILGSYNKDKAFETFLREIRNLLLH